MENRPERILVYALQSSGASWITWMLGQRQRWIVIPDLLNQIPTVEDFADLPTSVEGIIAKATVWPGESLDEHQARFRPHRTILVRRIEAANIDSLTRKGRGCIEEKLALWNETVKNGTYDELIEYEAFQPPPVLRSLADIEDYNISTSRWCRRGRRRVHVSRGGETNRRLWGFGGIRAVRWTQIPGKLTGEEGRLLRELATDRTVLEIGSLFGRSTICMAHVAHHVHAVDPHRPGNCDFRMEFRGRDTLAELRQNLRTAGVDRRVSLHVCTVGELWLSSEPLFDLAFIDGSHHRNAVLLDLRFAAACLKTDGLIACHDHAAGHPGVVAAVQEFGRPVRQQVGSLAVL